MSMWDKSVPPENGSAGQCGPDLAPEASFTANGGPSALAGSPASGTCKTSALAAEINLAHTAANTGAHVSHPGSPITDTRGPAVRVATAPQGSGLPSRAEHSRFVQRIRRRYPAELALLAPGIPRKPLVEAAVSRLLEGGRALPSALRVVRQLVLERLCVLDVEQGAGMEDITGAMTDLAEYALELALAHAVRELDARFGAPLNAHGERIDFWIVGMGKLGG